ncbi:hypothetical protein [Inmirania thermothiophila]|uniref:Tetratricopeptide repeat protein n=1 Tax=Inmirania thermothiophila TaxID=1750597 RepID=A0A3N1XU87_9GAMM|nr:hypothetical protein [Inmirania thermothiophila]ROR29828.1 hypothetical protein EDC57_2506 [Inmirania thermothiophila]
MTRRPRAGLLVALLLAASAAAAAPVEEARRLAEAGAPALALRLLEQADGAEAEALRLGLLARLRRWDEIVRRTEGAAADPALSARTEALLALGRPQEAVAALREGIWSEPAPAAEALRAWRRLLIRAYLAADRPADAHTAMLRFAQDYGEAGPEWLALQGRVLIRAGRPSEAARLLEGRREPGLRILRLHALLAGGAAPVAVAGALEELRAEAGPDEAGDLLLLEAAVAEAAGDLEAAAAARERLLAAAAPVRVLEGLVPQGPQALWALYAALGRREGNRLRLLWGDDAAWIEAAAGEAAARPVPARGLLAVVAAHGRDPAARGEAAARLAAALRGLPDGDRLLDALFLGAGHPPHELLPAALRAELAELALRRGAFAEASRLLAGVEAPPGGGGDGLAWRLRRARVLILGGRAEEGAQALARVLASPQPLDGPAIDRLLQVVFDLQTLGRHEAALALFDALRRRGVDIGRERELLFWSAESLEALGRHEEAAARYLRSATLLDPGAMDPWAVTARLRAADALAAAGLYGDAARLYDALLAAEGDPQRRALLQRRRHELRLKALAAGAAGS